MALEAGTRLGAHEIVGLLGAGGMGEVYRAHDTKLNRQVAIKVLPDAYASDPERVGRFHREAQAVAALNHPNIAAIYDSAESGDTKFLVLELVEGETLADRMRRGPVAVEEALAITKQILEALEAAHEKGICHRDLKPANVKLTPDGAVKVLDFGLAKFVQGAVAAGSLTHSPTLTVAGTFAGVILGTAGYMSPEQAKGFEADQRSDIFSFGCILYELLTRRKAFDGETASEILASVIKVEADFTSLPPRLNPRLTEVLRRCLEKSPKKRWHAAADVRVEIEAAMDRATIIDEPRAAPAVLQPLWKRTVPIVAALVAGAALAGYAAWTLKPEPARLSTRFAVVLPDDQQFTNTGRQLVALSPDGSNLVYVANNRLFLRPMSGLDASAIAGSEDSAGVLNPAFSPGGDALAFYSTSDRSLKRLALSGGAAVTIFPAEPPFGLSWDDSGILFGQQGKGILRVSSNGGTPEVLVPVGADEFVWSPQMLPGGHAVLFSVKKPTDSWDKGQVVVQALGGARTVVIDGGSDGRYLPTGHVVYALEGVLLAVPFDLRRLVARGGPVPVVEGVRRAGVSPTGTGTPTAQFSFSRTGTIAFVPGPAKLAGAGRTLAVFDRKGGAQPLKLPSDAYNAPRVSPDGKWITVAAQDDKEAVVWMYELSGSSARRRLTFGGRNQAPIWSADGQWITFQSDREGDLAIFRQRADGSGVAERLTKPETGMSHVPQAWSPDGSTLLFSIQKDQVHTLAMMTMTDRRVTVFDDIRSASPTEALFIAGGKWIVYRSATNVAGSVFVEPFPRTGAKYLVPQPGGHPFWIQKTGELVMNTGSNRSTSIAVRTTPSVEFGPPADFSRTGRSEPSPSANRRNVDALPDGEHVIGILAPDVTPAGTPASRIVVVQNWFTELQQRVPTR